MGASVGGRTLVHNDNQGICGLTRSHVKTARTIRAFYWTCCMPKALPVGLCQPGLLTVLGLTCTKNSAWNWAGPRTRHSIAQRKLSPSHKLRVKQNWMVALFSRLRLCGPFWCTQRAFSFNSTGLEAPATSTDSPRKAVVLV